MTFKQLMQANAIDVCQIDSVRERPWTFFEETSAVTRLADYQIPTTAHQCRVASVNEILAILLMAAK